MNSHRKSSTLSINSSRNKPLPPIVIDDKIPLRSQPQPSIEPLHSITPTLKPQQLVFQNTRSESSLSLSATKPLIQDSPSSLISDSSIFQPKTLKRRNLKKLTLSENKLSFSDPSNDGLIPTPLTSSSSKTSEDLELAENFEKLTVSINNSLTIRRKDILTLKKLGEGQSGVVSQVLHVPTNKTMARKQILFEKNIKVQNQILRELKILNEVHSPYIIDFYGALFIDSSSSCEDEDTVDSSTLQKKTTSSQSSPIKMLHSNKSTDEIPSISSNGVLIFMEYMDCGSLDYILKKLGFLKEVYLSKITHNVLQGLNYLYSHHKIIHRDIKPSNVLLNYKGELKICDFGVSRELSNNSIADTFVGTSTYMSPERIQGDVYSIKGDVWSLGLMLIELSTGEFPFGKKDTPNGILDLLQRIVNEDPPSLPKDKYSKELCDFVDLCLKKQNERLTPLELLNMPKSFVTKYDKEESGPLLRHLAKKIYKLNKEH